MPDSFFESSSRCCCCCGCCCGCCDSWRSSSFLSRYERFCEEIDFLRLKNLEGTALGEGASSSSTSWILWLVPIPNSRDWLRILESNQPVWYLLSRSNVPVKYLFVFPRRRDFGDVSGVEVGDAIGVTGNDLLPLRNSCFAFCCSSIVKLFLKPSADSSTVSNFATFFDIMRLATWTIDLPQRAGSPWKPSSVPWDLAIFVLVPEPNADGLISFSPAKISQDNINRSIFSLSS